MEQKSTCDVSFVDEVWSRDDAGKDLMVRLYRPKNSTNVNDAGVQSPPLPAIIEIHGGAWSSRDRTLDENINYGIAAAGFVVAALDFRQGPEHVHPAASADVVSALRWVRRNSGRLGIDPDRVGLMGTSSGGHLAMYAGTTPNSKQHAEPAEGEGKCDPVIPPKFIMALWPVSDPFARYRYAKRAGLDFLVKCHDGFYGTEERMREASVTRVVAAGEFESLPPLLVVQPGEDANVPAEITFDLIKSWQGRDGYLEYSFFPGEPHAFNIKRSKATPRLISLLADFARRHC